MVEKQTIEHITHRTYYGASKIIGYIVSHNAKEEYVIGAREDVTDIINLALKWQIRNEIKSCLKW